MNEIKRPAWAVVGTKLFPSSAERQFWDDCCIPCRKSKYAKVYEVRENGGVWIKLYDEDDVFRTNTYRAYDSDRDLWEGYQTGDLSGSYPMLPLQYSTVSIQMPNPKTESTLLLTLENQLLVMEEVIKEQKKTIKQLRNQIA